MSLGWRLGWDGGHMMVGQGLAPPISNQCGGFYYKPDTGAQLPLYIDTMTNVKLRVT